MSIRDWSSDGCSSDLFRAGGGWRQQRRGERRRRGGGGQTFPGRSHTMSPPRPNARRIAESGEGSLTLRPYLLPLRPESRTRGARSEEHKSELKSLMRNSYDDFFLKHKKQSLTMPLTCREHILLPKQQ